MMKQKPKPIIWKIALWDEITKTTLALSMLPLLLSAVVLYYIFKDVEAAHPNQLILMLLIPLSIFSISVLIIIYRVLEINSIYQRGIEVKCEFVSSKKWKVGGSDSRIPSKSESYTDTYVYYVNEREFYKKITEEKIDIIFSGNAPPDDLFVIVDPNNPKIAFWRDLFI